HARTFFHTLAQQALDLAEKNVGKPQCRVVLMRGAVCAFARFADSNSEQGFHALRARVTFSLLVQRKSNQKESTPRPRALRAIGAAGAQVRQKFL
ncbi:hypothetical protein ACFFJ4_05345, partial [Xanthomonas dyei]|uniref:hypothetical protein n=1 Tax=Xanthomonas dyei TaxID=743699 RepID=UPI0035EA544C